MDDGVVGESDDDEAVPLPRRAPGPSRIVEAHQRLFGDPSDTAVDGASGQLAGVERRERSAALARAVTARRATPAVVVPAATSDDDEASLLEVSDAPPVGDSATAESRPARPGGTSPRQARARFRTGSIAAVVILAFVAGAVAGFLLAPSEAPSTAAPPVRAVVSGNVVRVIDAGRLTVLVEDRPVEVAVLGLDPPRAAPDGTAACGTATATALANDSLTGRRVTLVPDAVGAEFDADGRRWAYVVLATQQNYTDLALAQGAGRWDTSRAVTYGEVFAREEAQARQASAGIWGPPCLATP